MRAVGRARDVVTPKSGGRPIICPQDGFEALERTAGRTHLNDALRALAEAPALVLHLARGSSMTKTRRSELQKQDAQSASTSSGCLR
jgi:hypothetical protein